MYVDALEEVVVRCWHVEFGVTRNDVDLEIVMVDVMEGREIPVLGGFGMAKGIKRSFHLGRGEG